MSLFKRLYTHAQGNGLSYHLGRMMNANKKRSFIRIKRWILALYQCYVCTVHVQIFKLKTGFSFFKVVLVLPLKKHRRLVTLPKFYSSL